MICKDKNKMKKIDKNIIKRDKNKKIRKVITIRDNIRVQLQPISIKWKLQKVR